MKVCIKAQPMRSKEYGTLLVDLILENYVTHVSVFFKIRKG